MKIKLGEKYFLNSDRYNWYITSERINKKGEVVEKNLTGYFGKMEDCLKEAVRVKIKTSDVKTLNELVDVMQETFDWIGTIVRELETKIKSIDDESLLEEKGDEDGSEPVSEFGDEDL